MSTLVATFYSLLTPPPQILNLPSTSPNLAFERDAPVTFLDEFRMILFTSQISPGVLDFALFDTFVPRGHQMNSRRFSLPPRYHDWTSSICVDNDRCLGTLDQDGSLTTDPTQAVLVMMLSHHLGPSVLLIVRIQTLIERARSKGTDPCVPWDTWGSDAASLGWRWPNRA